MIRNFKFHLIKRILLTKRLNKINNNKELNDKWIKNL